jgi:hypothetical protein
MAWRGHPLGAEDKRPAEFAVLVAKWLVKAHRNRARMNGIFLDIAIKMYLEQYVRNDQSYLPPQPAGVFRSALQSARLSVNQRKQFLTLIWNRNSAQAVLFQPVNTSLGSKGESGWSASLWAKNLFNSYSWSVVASNAMSWYVPRTRRAAMG